ncbi:MAG: NADH-quinone oxidoreductase subunit K [Acidimicrobiia bacterium]
MTVLLAATAALLFTVGTYLVLQRRLSRIIIGLGLITHGANTLLVTSGRRGHPPILGPEKEKIFSDPVPQALALTAIVITFAVTALLLAMAYRSWILTNDDQVEDDIGDRAIANRIAAEKTTTDQEKWLAALDDEEAQ